MRAALGFALHKTGEKFPECPEPASEKSPLPLVRNPLKATAVGEGVRMMKNKAELLIMVIAFVVIGILLILGSWWFTRDARAFTERGIKVTGTIVDFQKGTPATRLSEAADTSLPVIEFTTQTGNRIKVITTLVADKKELFSGKRVYVIYNPDNPQDVRVESLNNLEGGAIYLLIVGAAFIGVALVIYLVLYKEININAMTLITAGFAISALLLVTLTFILIRECICCTW